MFLLTRTNLDVPKHRGPHVLPRADVGARVRAAADPHAVGQAHEHHVLRRRARRRRVARRRRRRRLAGDAGRVVVRARRRRWRARRASGCWPSPRRTRARRSTTTVARSSTTDASRDALARLAIDTEVADLLTSRAAWVAASGGLPGIEGAASKLFATEAFQRSVNRLVDVAGPAGLVQAHDVSDLERVLRVLLPLRARHHDLRRHQRDPAQPRRPARARPAARQLTGRSCAGCPASRSIPRSRPSAPTCAGSSPARSRVAARDFTDLTGWDEAFERDVVRAAGAAGYLGVSLPVDLGGGGKPPSWQAALSYEAAYHDAPLIDTAAVLVAPTVATFGTVEQRDTVVRGRVRGHGERVHRVHGGGRRQRPVEHRDDGHACRTTAASCSTARRCSSRARTRPTGAARSRAPIRRRAASAASRCSSSTWRRPVSPSSVTRPRTGGRSSTLRFDGARVGGDAVLGEVGQRMAPAQRRAARRAQRRGVARMGDPHAGSPARPLRGDARPGGAHRARRPGDALVRGRRTRGAGDRDAGRRPCTLRRGRDEQGVRHRAPPAHRPRGRGDARTRARSPRRAGSADRCRSGSPTRWWSASTRR